ncbi:MAG: ferredoxin, 2Fe-2S [Candidatus Peribacteria bacterium]|nr:ferredoxin, 2Fe-2S [Candidatus Peribacteria bacterium]
MPTVTFISSDGKRTEVEAESGQTLLQIALDHNVDMEHACGGNGFCTTCMCKVKSGMENLSERNDREENMGVVDDPDRLSCQSQVLGNVEVEVIEY